MKNHLCKALLAFSLIVGGLCNVRAEGKIIDAGHKV
jgi:hypothetical protein